MSLQSLRAEVPEFILKGDPACSQVDPEMFFPEEEELPNGRLVAVYKYQKQAVDICRSCPLIADCLTYAIRNGEVGIWGGMTENQRRRLKQRTGIKLSR